MPTVCKITLDAAEYRKQLDAVLTETRSARGQLEQAGSASPAAQTSQAGQTSQTSQTQVPEAAAKTAEKLTAVADKAAVAETALKKTGQTGKESMETIGDAIRHAREDLEFAGQSAGPVANNLNNAGKQGQAGMTGMLGGVKAVWSEMTKLDGGAKRLVTSILAGGGLIGIMIAGVNGAIKAGVAIYEMFTSAAREAAEASARNASNIRSNAEANEAVRQKTDGLLSSLQNLASKEKLSNVEKAEAIRLVNELKKSYGGLGITLDETTGKLRGVDEATVAKLKRDKERRTAEINAELKSISSEKTFWESERDAGKKVPGTNWLTDGGLTLGWDLKARAAKAQEKLPELDHRQADLLKQLGEVRRSSDDSDFIEKRKGENADLRKGLADSEKQVGRKKADDDFGDAKTADDKLANRQKVLNAELEKRAELMTKLEAAELRYQQAIATPGVDATEKLEAEKSYLNLKNEVLQADGRVYEVEEQIADVNDDRAEAVRKLQEQNAFEVQYQQLILDKEYEKAEQLKLEYDLKQQNLRLSEAERDTLDKQLAKRRELNLQQSMKSGAESLYDSALRQAGRSQEADLARAMRDAERTKGGALTQEETDAVKRLAELTTALGELGELQRDRKGVSEIETNELTARGGFSSGVAMDKDNVNTDTLNSVRQIQQLLLEIVDLTEEGNKT